MAAFSSYQQPLFLADPAFSPDFSAIRKDGNLEAFMPNLLQFYTSSANCQEGYSVDASAHESSCIDQQSVHNEPSLTGKQGTTTESLSMVDRAESGEPVTNWVPSDKKRKSQKEPSSNSANSKDARQGKCKKQKGDKGANNDVKCNNDNDQNKVAEEPPKGYIHVRARRGQATDSHSLAERVRREKISERMKTLQALVPGCDKVTGKALMLNEIINYVQSLQTQVEFLSMRLASLDPMVYTFGLMDPDAMVFGTEMQGIDNNSTTMPTPLIQPSSSIPGSKCQPQDNLISNADACSAARTTFPAPLIDTSTTFLHENKPIFPALQDVGSSYCGVNEQLRQSLINQFGFSANNNLYSLQ